MVNLTLNNSLNGINKLITILSFLLVTINISYEIRELNTKVHKLKIYHSIKRTGMLTC